ncbi:MAG TPA: hypothetical protein P5295_13690 [Spirochaetota bacterium]|nr:hypothetical protein [Spirochaetota bacterium]
MIDFKKAYYIKLGSHSKWASNSLENNLIRIGWSNIPINLIKNNDWDEIYKINRLTSKDDGSATRDFNALKRIITADEKTVFITFENSMLYWCIPSSEVDIEEDKISKFRRVKGSWSSKDIDGNLLYINRISGNITKTQRFSGTLCKIHDFNTLHRLLNHQISEDAILLNTAKINLEKTIEAIIKNLHWKDFELLIDLMFRETGWQRISVLGESMKFVDLELIDPITEDLYQVQIKSSSSKDQFIEYVDKFDNENFRRLYYIVHTISDDLSDSSLLQDKDVEIWSISEIAKNVVKYGLVDWLIDKTM